jgi:hypothetical protein
VVLNKNISRAARRQVDLTTAVCQERLLATHVQHVLALVDLVSDQLPFDRALDVYVRILGLNAEQARNIGSRALAALGRRGGLPDVEDLEFTPDEEEPDEGPRDEGEGRGDRIFSKFKRRIRGRVQDDLRNRIALAAARAEDDLLATHVRNSLTFVKALKNEVSDANAVELYLDTMVLPEGVADVVYNRALRTIADKVLPPVEEAHGVAAASASASPPATEAGA